MKTLTIQRETNEIFTIVSDFPFWSNGGIIQERVAFSGDSLSNMRAQAIDRANGKSYILIAPFGVANPVVLAAAKTMQVGEIKTVTL